MKCMHWTELAMRMALQNARVVKMANYLPDFRGDLVLLYSPPPFRTAISSSAILKTHFHEEERQVMRACLTLPSIHNWLQMAHLTDKCNETKPRGFCNLHIKNYFFYKHVPGCANTHIWLGLTLDRWSNTQVIFNIRSLASPCLITYCM